MFYSLKIVTDDITVIKQVWNIMLHYKWHLIKDGIKTDEKKLIQTE